MAGFLYFIPEVALDDVTPAELVRRGLKLPLADLIADWRPGENVAVSYVRGACEGADGVLLYPVTAAATLPRKMGYCEATQHWRFCGEFWLGVDAERPPGPADLIRDRPVDGYPTTLADGREWECPIIRKPINVPAVPTSAAWGSDGKYTAQVLPHFQDAWQTSGRLFDLWACRDGGSGIIDSETLATHAVEMLAVNYRVGKHEATQLQLITTETAQAICEAAIDAPLIKELTTEITEDDDRRRVKKNVSPQPLAPAHTLHGQPGAGGNQAGPITT